MKHYRVMVALLLSMAVGYGVGFYHGKRVADEDWSRRTITGVSVDCYESNGKLVEDIWGKRFGAVTLACAPGQIAKLHQTFTDIQPIPAAQTFTNIVPIGQSQPPVRAKKEKR